MKKILLILIVSSIFVFTGCSKPKEQVIEEKIEITTVKEEANENEEVNKEVPQITDDDIKIIQESVKNYTVATSLEGLSDNDVSAYFGNGNENNICLFITVEKSLDELMKYWNTNANSVTEKMERSLVFDVIKDNIKDKLSYNDYQYISVIYEYNNQVYATQQFEND